MFINGNAQKRDRYTKEAQQNLKRWLKCDICYNEMKFAEKYEDIFDKDLNFACLKCLKNLDIKQ